MSKKNRRNRNMQQSPAEKERARKRELLARELARERLLNHAGLIDRIPLDHHFPLAEFEGSVAIDVSNLTAGCPFPNPDRWQWPFEDDEAIDGFWNTAFHSFRAPYRKMVIEYRNTWGSITGMDNDGSYIATFEAGKEGSDEESFGTWGVFNLWDASSGRRVGGFGYEYTRYQNGKEELHPPVGCFNTDRDFLRGTVIMVACVVFRLFGFLNARNIELVDAPAPPPKVAQKYEREFGQPMTRYKVLKVNPVRKVYDRDGDGETDDEKALRSLHLVRGHFRHNENHPIPQFNGTFWIPSHARGSEQAGITVKDYKVESPDES